MSAININYRFIFRICLLAFIIAFTCYFPNIMLYFFLAFIFSLMGKPIARKISSLKIFKKNIHYTVSSLLVVILFVVLFFAAMLFFIPILVKEFRVLENINFDALGTYFSQLLTDTQNFLYRNNFIEENETLVGIFADKFKNIANVGFFANILENIVSSTGSFLFGLFCVIFMTFFFIKDDINLSGIVNIFFNKNYVEQANIVVKKINYSLTRYCVVTVVNTFVMIILVYLVLLLLGVKGAFLMATIVGVLNIIPYVGPILGGAIACLLGIIHCVGLGVYTDILPVMIKIIATVLAVNGVDNMVILPLMYSKSIQLHPIESLLITIIAGKIAGMGGMLLGIPVYTVLRIIVIEIYNFVNKENDEAPVFKFIRKRNKLNTNNHEDSGLSEI